MKTALLSLAIAATLFVVAGCGQRHDDTATAAACPRQVGSRYWRFGAGRLWSAARRAGACRADQSADGSAATDRHAPAKVIVELEVREVEKEYFRRRDLHVLDFGGTVPAALSACARATPVEFHLKNHQTARCRTTSTCTASPAGRRRRIEFHRAGHESQFTFKALNPGCIVYHCATAPVGMHVANGMYGLLLVEPPEGLPKVDHEYYVMQGDFYTSGRYREKGHQNFDIEKAIDEKPTYVLFNGAEGALTGDKALAANTGETVRLFVGNGGPNLVSSFHVIGEIFDKVWFEGGTNYQENVQTTLIPAGGAAIMQFHLEVPGTTCWSITASSAPSTRAPWPCSSQRSREQGDLLRQGSRFDLCRRTRGAESRGRVGGDRGGGQRHVDLEQQIKAGGALFNGTCTACHQADGKGMPGVFPPLAKSDYLAADPKRALWIITHGLTGKVTVNGQDYNSVMPPMTQLNDDEVANIATYVLNSWDNPGGRISADDVAKARKNDAMPGAGH
jgi:nitrite reductase (NO-forming)